LISALVRTSYTALKRDRAALLFVFVLPIAFFSIFAMVFGGSGGSTPKVKVIVVDQDHSQSSRRLVAGLSGESALTVFEQTSEKDKPSQPYTAESAEAAVKSGKIPAALIIPRGFGDHPISFGGTTGVVKLQLLHDSSDPIASQILMGMLQKTAMTSLSPALRQEGLKATGEYLGGFTADQQQRINALSKMQQSSALPEVQQTTTKSSGTGSLLNIEDREVLGETRTKPLISFYAAGIGVMFLLFTASSASGTLLDEADSGTLDRVLSTRITMTKLLLGKLSYNILLAFAQLTLMFIWGYAIFHVDLPHHIGGFIVIGLSTSFAVASFGMLLASLCKTRAQLGSLSTLLILVMSSLGGSMFPRYLMPEAMQQAGLFTINAWAIDGFTKIFWREEPVLALWPQVGVLLATGVVLFLLARRAARRWEFA